jgi:hypothetical protein
MDRQFHPGNNIVREKCTQKQFDGMKMIGVEAALPKNKDGR